MPFNPPRLGKRPTNLGQGAGVVNISRDNLMWWSEGQQTQLEGVLSVIKSLIQMQTWGIDVHISEAILFNIQYDI